LNRDIAMPDLDDEQKPSRRLWVFAAVAALALHVAGGALALAHLRPSDLDDTFGAQAIEVGLEVTSPDVEASDLPPGPDMEDSVPSPAMVEQKVEAKESELPKGVPTETDNPDQAVTREDSKKPKDNDAKIAAVEMLESPEATAKQSLDDSLPKASAAAAPNIGLGKDTQKLKAKWESRLSAYIQSHLRYPKDRENKTTTVIVNLVFNRLGHVLSVGIEKSSGDRSFDEAALSVVRRSDPLPQPPSTLTDEEFSYVLPVEFRK
jgi:TonB family protein